MGCAMPAAASQYANAVTSLPACKSCSVSLSARDMALLLPPVSSHINNNFIEEGELVEIDIEERKEEKVSDNSLFVNELRSKIIELVQNEKIYEDPELSLTQMAKQLQTNASILSKAINQGFDMCFNDFINQYRIEAVKEKLIAGEQKTQTLLGIAYDCGFNSKATFNRAFKKATGQSPKDWIKQQIIK